MQEIKLLLTVDGQQAIQTVRLTDAEVQKLGKDAGVTGTQLDAMASAAAVPPQVQRQLDLLAQKLAEIQATTSTSGGQPLVPPIVPEPGNDPLPAFNQNLGSTTQLIQSFGFVANDAQQFSLGFDQGIRSISNNLLPFASILARVNAEAKETGTSLGGQLAGALRGPAGVIALLNLAATAAVLFGDKIGEAFDSGVEKAEDAKKRLADVYDQIIEISQAEISFTFDDDQIDAAISGTEQQLEQLRAQLQEEDSAVDIAVGTLGAAGQRALQQLEDSALNRTRLTREEREEIEASIVRKENLLQKLTDERDLTEAINQARQDAIEAGGTDLAQQERLAELSLEALSGRTRDLEELRRWYQERIELAAGNTAEITLIEQARTVKLAEINERYRKEGAKSQREYLRTLERQQELADDLRIEQITDGRARELAEIARWEAEKLELAQGNAELLALVESVAALRRQEVNEQYYQEAIDAERDFQDQLRQIRQDRQRQRGVAESDILSAERDRLDLELALQTEGTDRYRETYLERERIALQFFDAVGDEAVRATEAQVREDKRALDELKQAQRERLREIQRYTDRVVDLFVEAATRERRFTQTDIDLQQESFRERQRNLERQLADEELTQREFDLRMRRLAEDRAEFEKQVAADSASFVVSSLLGVVELAQAVALEVIKAELAEAAAKAIPESIETFGLPGVLLAGGAIAAIFALEGVIRSAAGFNQGGFVGAQGQSGRDTVPAMLGRGEAVLNRHQQRGVDDALLSTYGFPLEELFRRITRPHYLAEGGFAGSPILTARDRGLLQPAALPSSSAARPAAPAGAQGPQPLYLVLPDQVSRSISQRAEKLQRMKNPRRRRRF